MGGLSVDGSKMPMVESVEEMVGRFCGELNTKLRPWSEQLTASPESLESLEMDVHAAFARGADLVVAGLIAVTMKNSDFDQAAETTRKRHPNRLNGGRNRTIKIRLLGGLIVWITSLYCLPRKSLFRSASTSLPGVHIELVQFGIGKGTSPGLQSRVARKVALLPSFATARAELKREGVKLNVKAVRRIALECGDNLLVLRKSQLEQWRAGEMPAGTELAGKRVSVQIDGGRMKIRGKLEKKKAESKVLNDDGLPMEDSPGRSKPTAARTYAAEWREPKLMTIFIHNEKGKMVPHSKATIDGTLLGPDAICELVAMHLHRLGAKAAESVTFLADGAPWIWDRIDQIVEKAGLQGVKIHQVLDNSHAAHHISLALEAKGFDRQERLPLFRHYRTLLRNGHWRQIVDELTDFGELDLSTNDALATEIGYLRKHGEAGRLKYPFFVSIGVPIGSGAIESTIRRVINKRLKSNGMFWREENAEAMLLVRASVISERWDAQRLESKKLMHRLANKDWTWVPNNMSCKKNEASDATAS